MARWGNCDYRQLQHLRSELNRLQAGDLSDFFRDMSRELAARLLALVIPRTPVGDYKVDVEVTAARDSKYHKKGEVYLKRVNRSGKTGGTLRRGWTARTEGEAAGGRGSTVSQEQILTYVQGLLISKVGSAWQVEVINPVFYASYVEFGHVTRSRKGWVKGRFFLTISEEKLRSVAPAILEQRLNQKLAEVFGNG